MPRKKTEIENSPNTKGRNPRVSKDAKQTAPDSKIEEPPKCHVHDKVEYWVDDVHEKVCVNDELLPEFEGKHYCLFHLPTKNKDLVKFKKIFEARLKAVRDKITEAEKLSEVEQAEANGKLCYDFRYVWFPSEIYFPEYKFSVFANFNLATFAADAYFSKATFLADAHFSEVKFLTSAFFTLATFSANAQFNWAAFSAETSFNRAIFLADANFFSATFSADALFKRAKFSKKGTANFKRANFEKDTYFDRARFRNEVSFNSTIFGENSDVFFRDAFFVNNADFRYCTAEGYLRFSNLRQGKESKFDFQEAAFEKASRISFHTVRLRPNWFVNIDSRKFVFTDINWQNFEWKVKRGFREKLKFAGRCLTSGWRQCFLGIDEQMSENITAELASLKARDITDSGKRLLEVGCRQLAVNAEENNRYEEASKFRYMAMETRRLESKGVWRFLNLHWFYKWSSGYGESWARAAIILLGILFLCGVFYNSPFAYFEMPEKKKEQENVSVINDLAKPKPPEYYKMNNLEGFIHSLYVAAIQRPEPKPAADSNLTKAFVILETIFAPLQAALLALAIRRKFMR